MFSLVGKDCAPFLCGSAAQARARASTLQVHSGRTQHQIPNKNTACRADNTQASTGTPARGYREISVGMLLLSIPQATGSSVWRPSFSIAALRACFDGCGNGPCGEIALLLQRACTVAGWLFASAHSPRAFFHAAALHSQPRQQQAGSRQHHPEGSRAQALPHCIPMTHHAPQALRGKGLYEAGWPLAVEESEVSHPSLSSRDFVLTVTKATPKQAGRWKSIDAGVDQSDDQVRR
eukprot:719975-Pelagomonas_calceolata.AAC.7